jgi:DNA-binding response OmpR family regulator
MKRMIVVETDDDLAECVARFFSGRFDVRRAATLDEASTEIKPGDSWILFADIGSDAPDDLSVLERIRHDNPDVRIILSYLTPPNCGDWNKRSSECADMVLRKPYRLLDIERIIRKW